MRDFITVTALLVSLSGIAVSLAREEVRCYIGLNAEPCQAKETQSPGSIPPQTASESSDINRDRPFSEEKPNANEAPLDSGNKVLNKVNSGDTLPSNPKKSPETPVTETQPPATHSDSPPPAHTELKAAPETIAPPAPNQPVSNNLEPKANEQSTIQPSTNIPLKVEPYSPQTANN
jgi:hypothetical protein